MATKKKIALAVFIIVIALATWWAILQTPRHQLEKLGYSKEEAGIIIEKLDEPSIELVLACGYEDDLLELLRHSEFKPENFVKYLNAKVADNLTKSEIVLLVNHPDYDSSVTYEREMLAIMRDEYYLSDRRERYFELWQKMQLDEDKDIAVPFGNAADGEAGDCAAREAETEAASRKARQIVASVNANRDHAEYEQAQAADISQPELMLVNKYRNLDQNYQPEVLELSSEFGQPGVVYAKAIEPDLLELLQSAREDGFKLYITSGYRSYAEQQEVLDGYLATMSESEALRYAARPGFSEHQTGLALDIFTIGGTIDNFATMPEARWLADNAYKYGFTLRYPAGKEDITGFDYEAWHYRYVGKEAAAYLKEHDLTFDEYVVWKTAQKK